MRQRLSSEPDRYRGRRRVPTPPRSRYAVVGAAAFLGAGAVALGAAQGGMPDAKAVSPQVLHNLEEASSVTTQDALADRDAGDRANRSQDRSKEVASLSEEEIEQEAWLLPLEDYEFTSPFGIRFGKLHAGIDLAAPEGTPYKAIHAGEVIQSGYNGGFGYSVTVQDADGTQIIYAHSRRVLVEVGTKVKAGQVLGEVGMTGYSYGTHLHIGVYVKGKPVDPVPFLRQHGVDIKLKIESVYGALAAS